MGNTVSNDDPRFFRPLSEAEKQQIDAEMEKALVAASAMDVLESYYTFEKSHAAEKFLNLYIGVINKIIGFFAGQIAPIKLEVPELGEIGLQTKVKVTPGSYIKSLIGAFMKTEKEDQWKQMEPKMWQAIAIADYAGIQENIHHYMTIPDTDTAKRLHIARMIQEIIVQRTPTFQQPALGWRNIRKYYVFASLHVALLKDIVVMDPAEEGYLQDRLQNHKEHLEKLIKEFIATACVEAYNYPRIRHYETDTQSDIGALEIDDFIDEKLPGVSLFCRIPRGPLLSLDKGPICEGRCSHYAVQLKIRSAETLTKEFIEPLVKLGNYKHSRCE